jgi:hypothetical protein
MKEQDDCQADDQVRGDDRRLQLIEGEQRQQRMEQRPEQAAFDEPVRVAEAPVELGVGVEERGDALEDADDAGEPARGEWQVAGSDPQRVDERALRRDGSVAPRYCCAPETDTLMS